MAWSFTAWPIALGQVVLVVLLAFLVNRFARQKRAHVRRTAITLFLYVVAIGVYEIARAVDFPRLTSATDVLADILGSFTCISIVSVAVFDLALPAVRLDPARIIVDLAMGLAYIVTTFVVLQHSGVQLLGLVTTSAVVTGILALSLQATLGNVIGGVALQVDNSIRAGDWIQLENGKQGRVRQVRWRHTVIETRDWDTIIVPNAALLAANIIILGKREGQPLQHRMWVYFNVEFRHRPGAVIRAVEDALRAAPIEGVATEPAPNCICYDFARAGGDGYAYYAVRYWLTDLSRDDPTSSLVRVRIDTALARAGIEFAFPSQHIHAELDDAERRERHEQKEHRRRLKALNTLAFLGPLTDEEKGSIARSLRYAPFATGETMTKQGAVAHWLYIMTEGTADVVASKGEESKRIAKITSPSFFGEMGCMTGKPRAATVIATSDVICYRLDRQAFVDILNERPQIAADISSLLAERRVELGAAKGELDEASRRTRIEQEKRQILPMIEAFFGLRDESPAKK